MPKFIRRLNPLLLAGFLVGLAFSQPVVSETTPINAVAPEPAAPIWSAIEGVESPNSIDFDPSGNRLVVASLFGLTVFNTADGASIAKKATGSFERHFSGAMMSADGNSIHLVVSRDGEQLYTNNYSFETHGLNGAPPPKDFTVDVPLYEGQNHGSGSADPTGKVHFITEGYKKRAHIVYPDSEQALVLNSDFSPAAGTVFSSGQVALVTQNGLTIYDESGAEVSRIDGGDMGFSPGKVALSVDENTLVVSSVYDGLADGGFRVFDMNAGKVAYDLPLPQGDQQYVEDMKVLETSVVAAFVDYTIQDEKILKIYKLAKSQQPELIKTVSLGGDGAIAAISPNASTLAVSWFSGRLSLYSLSPEPESPAEQPDEVDPSMVPTLVAGLGHSGQISDVALSPDGRLLASAGDNGLIWIWDMHTNRAINSVTLSENQPKLLFSDDGQYLYALNSLKLYQIEVETGKLVKRVEGSNSTPILFTKSPSASGFFSCDFYYCDKHSGEPGSWPQSFPVPIRAFSQALLCGEQLILRNMEEDHTLFAIVPLDEAGEDRFFTLASKVTYTACAGEGRLLLGTEDGWMLRTSIQGDVLDRVQLGGKKIQGITPVATGEILAVMNGQGHVGDPDIPAQLFLLSPEDLSVQKSAVFPPGQDGTAAHVDHLILSQDQKMAITTTQSGISSPGKMTRWSLPDLVPSDGPATTLRAPQHLQFSPDGKTLAVTFRDSTALWSLATGQVTAQQQHNFGARVQLTNQGISSIGGIGSLNDMFTYSIETDFVPVHVPSKKNGVNHTLKLVSNQNDTAILLTNDDAQVGLVSLSGIDPISAVSNPSHEALVASGYDSQALLWSAKTGKSQLLDARIVGQPGVAFSPDGTLVALAEKTGFVSLWNILSGELLVRLLSMQDGGWAVVGPQGRYDASDPGDVPGLSWVLPDAPFSPEPIETYYLDYYEPRLLGRKVLAEALPALRLPSDRNRVTPEIRFANLSKAAMGTDGIARITVELELQQGHRGEAKSGVGPVKLFREGQLIRVNETARFDSGDTITVRFEGIQLPPDQGNIEFSAYAFNDDSIKSETATYLLAHAAQDNTIRRAYVLAVGVNAYENPSWDLSYAASDAEANASLISMGLEASGEFESVHSLALISREQTEPRLARRDVIEAILNQIAGQPMDADLPRVIVDIAKAFPPARPQDLVYVALAGHGLATSDGQFHFFPQEFGAGTNGRVVNETTLQDTLNSDRLANLLLQIDVRDMLLVIDACNSAASIEGGGFRPGPMGSRGLGQLAYDKSMRVLAASQSEALALESDQLLHGALSYAMLREGLEAQNADRAPQNGAISFTELFEFTTERVPSLYGELSTGDFIPLSRGFTSLIDDSAVAVLDAQRPALFDFRKARYDDITMKPPIVRPKTTGSLMRTFLIAFNAMGKNLDLLLFGKQERADP